MESVSRTQLLLSILLLLCSCGAEEDTEALSCPEHQQGFDSSCYEFVVLQRSFFSAQGWCERGGGHLAFVQNEETQQFLQKHLESETDWWLGLAPTSSNLILDSAAEGPLSWLDGSDVSYSNFVSSPSPGAGCAHVLRNSGFQWEATANCSQEFTFVCEFESGRTIACAHQNARLHCGSGQVIEVDDSFYGRKTAHYCRPSPNPSLTSTQEECSWMDVVDSVTGDCDGLQVCQTTVDVASFGDPCPGHGSYLSVEYHCKEGHTVHPSPKRLTHKRVSRLKEHVIIPRSFMSITASPSNDVYNITVTLGLTGTNVNKKYLWQCETSCKCNPPDVTMQSLTIPPSCLPDPFSYYNYTCTEWNNNGIGQLDQDSKCITVTPPPYSGVKIICLYNCGLVDVNTNVLVGLECTSCPTVVWSIEDFRPYSDLNVPVPIKDCHENARTKPLILNIYGGNQYNLMSNNLRRAQALSKNIIIVAYDNITPGFTKFTVQILRSPSPVTYTTSPVTYTTSPVTYTPSPVTYTTSPVTYTTSPVTYTPSPVTYTTSPVTYTTSPVTYTTSPITFTTSPVPITTSPVPITTSPVPITTSPVTTTSPVIVSNSISFGCGIFPSKGTVLTAFNITCTQASCTDCQYCFQTDSDIYLRCSDVSQVNSLYLPVAESINNYKLLIVATVTDKITKTSNNTVITTEVRPANSSSTVQELQSAVVDSVAQLQEQGLLSGENLGQMFQSVSDMLNKNNDEDQREDREKLREQMLTIITEEAKVAPCRTPRSAQVTARAVSGLTIIGSELTTKAQKQASSLVADLSSSLLTMNISQEGEADDVLKAATAIVQVASNLLEFSSNKTISDYILNSLDCIQSVLLIGKKVNEGPTIIRTAKISVFVKRALPETLHIQSIADPKNTSSSFSFPSLPAGVLAPKKPLDLRMMSLANNPFTWSQEGNISGVVGSMSISKENGSVIPIENLVQEIEILLPRLDGEQVNSTILNLSNYSTMKINVSSPDVTLVLRMEPSKDLTFNLFLGDKNYLTIADYVAKTKMPHQGSKQEERYIWVLAPGDRGRHVGEHYLVVQPIVEAGVKSVNASVSVTSIAAQCKYWNESESAWSEAGCRVGPLTTPFVTQCLCNHLTFFGSSFFVMPNVVDVSRTAELFSTFTKNPVVVCFVGAIFLAYLLVVVWARRKDINDAVKVKVTVLKDNDPLAEYGYMLNISTGHRCGASTSAQVTITLLGTDGESEPHHLTDPDKPVFERGAVDTFLLTTPFSLGELQSIRMWHDNSGEHPSWYVNKVMIQDLQTRQKWHFLCNSWLAIDMGDCLLDRSFPVATELDLKRFSNLFFMKTAKDFCDGHIWFSVISRPANSTFTCVQRVSCCFSLLLCTMLTNIMFYGIPTDPSEQTMDLGHIEFTWQQVMIGVQSSIIMFPINLLIVSIFRNTRPREKKPGQPKTETSKQEKTGRVSPSQPPSPQMEHKNITPDTVIKDIKRIARSLSKAMKSPIPRLELELGSGRQADINILLSLVEDIIKQQNRADGEFYTDACKREGSLLLSLGSVDLQDSSLCGSPEKTVDKSQKLSNNSQYLYRQLCHVEKELSLLGPSRFPNPHSYQRALQQVQGMKALLESQLSYSSLGGDQPARSISPAESLDEDTIKRKCCQGGLPWWFVFVGWILVLATSGVSGFYTMIYGLDYGKERSISWLISMVVSFFESLLITQPLKVLGFAVFFALVLKKVDQEEYGDPKVDGILRNPDEAGAMWAARRDSTCSFYQPPLPSDIEKMRNNMMKEQKVFALIREILTYMGFMWMLLLVAYGQRDPNAYFLTRHIQQSFSQGISDNMSPGDVFTWANTSLLNNLFGEYPGFITDGNSKLVGNARLRQLRVHKNSCRVARSMRQSVPDCHAPYSWEVEDMGSYGPGWNRSVGVSSPVSLRSPWKYQSQARLRSYPVWGSLVLYRGGGFVEELGPDLYNASRTIQYLFDSTWIDMYTRAVFIEFTVYNANVNLFCIVTLMLESTAVGAFQFHSELQSVRLYQSTGGLHIFVLASEVIYFLFILYYMFVQGKIMKQHKWGYFRSKFNLVELAIIVLSWSALSVFIKRTLLGNRDMAYYHDHKDEFASFHDTANADAVLGYLIAFLVLLATVKLWHLMRLNSKLHMITATLQRAWTDISGFLVVITIMTLAYSIVFNLIYGWRLSSYKTIMEAARNMVSLQLGIFNYDEIMDYNPVLGGFLIGTCIVFMTFVVLNLFISVILVAFSEEQKHHKPSDEEETVDLMLMKLCGLFGIKGQQKNLGERPTGSATNNEPFNISL